MSKEVGFEIGDFVRRVGEPQIMVVIKNGCDTAKSTKVECLVVFPSSKKGKKLTLKTKVIEIVDSSNMDLLLRQPELPNNLHEATMGSLEVSELNFEKSFLYVTGGALGVTMFFIEKIVALQNASYKIALFASWSFFAISLMFSLFAHLYSSRAHLKVMEAEKDIQDEVLGKQNRIILIFNWLILVLTFLGICLFLAFVFININ